MRAASNRVKFVTNCQSFAARPHDAPRRSRGCASRMQLASAPAAGTRLSVIACETLRRLRSDANTPPCAVAAPRAKPRGASGTGVHFRSRDSEHACGAVRGAHVRDIEMCRVISRPLLTDSCLPESSFWLLRTPHAMPSHKTRECAERAGALRRCTAHTLGPVVAATRRILCSPSRRRRSDC